jgi:hypothetical protein
MVLSVIFAFFSLLRQGVTGLLISPKSLEGIESLESGLTDKQLGIQRYFAELTFRAKDLDDWTNWGTSIHDVDCDGNTCIRYEIAGLAYAAAMLGMKMPAYQQISQEIMYNSILRMIQPVVWQYIELFDDFKDQPSYPDPVAYKNIMYSGHLVQMIGMFEAIFGNFTFSSDGWDFVWKNSSSSNNEVVVIHYNTSLLMQRVYEESLVYGIAGVPCEPDSIFVICNNYPQNGWLLYDSLHLTNYTSSSIPSWAKVVKQHGINHLQSDEPRQQQGQQHEKNQQRETVQSVETTGRLENYFKLDYLIKPLGIWEPIATIGSDLWALGWMKTWWPLEDISSSLNPAFDFILYSSCWNHVDADTPSQFSSAVTDNISSSSSSLSPSSSLYPYAFLHPDETFQKLFPFNDMITTSFYPMVEKQFLSSSESNELGRYTEVMKYFESQFGQSLDLTGDGIGDLYQYNSNLCQDSAPYSSCDSGDYSIWATSNLLIGMLSPTDDLNYLRNLFNPTEDDRAHGRGKGTGNRDKSKGSAAWFAQYQNQPKVESVEYPHVMVSYAHYYSSASCSSVSHNLTALLKPGDVPPSAGQTHIVILSHIPSDAQSALVLTIDSEVSHSYRVEEEGDAGGYIKLLVEVPGWTDTNAIESKAVAIELLF